MASERQRVNNTGAIFLAIGQYRRDHLTQISSPELHGEKQWASPRICDKIPWNTAFCLIVHHYLEPQHLVPGTPTAQTI